MNFRKHNKFKSYLDIMIRAFYFLYVCLRRGNGFHFCCCEFYEIFERTEIRKEENHREESFIATLIRNFEIYELETDQRLSVSDELSVKLMAVDTSLNINSR